MGIPGVSKTQHSWRDHSPGVHVTAGVDLRDDTLASDSGFTGLAVKQNAPSMIDTPRADVNLITAGTKYFVLDSGECDVEIPAGVGAVAKGDRLYINPATNAWVLNPAQAAIDAAALRKCGVIRYIAPERGLTTGIVTVGLDARKDF